jgi:hypothetical protein
LQVGEFALCDQQTHGGVGQALRRDVDGDGHPTVLAVSTAQIDGGLSQIIQ